jgi:hypothetical protein
MFPSKLPLLPLVLDDIPWGLRQMLAQEGIPTVSRDQRRSRGCYLLYDSRNGRCRQTAPGQVTIDINRLRAGFDSDPFEQWGDHRTWRFQWHLDGLKPSEEIGRTDKHSLRRKLMARLRRIVERRGGVWLGVSAHPFPYRSAFNLRIDYDQFDPGDFYRLQTALETRQHAVSHFVNGAAYDSHGEALERLIGLDVGGHGYRHHTYQTYEENLRNIERGIQVLEEARLRPIGFTAPHGCFNRSLLAALEHLEIGHSSEFAAGYDELPFLPTGSSVLQLPIHPVCLGIILEAALAARPAHDGIERHAIATAERHFQTVIQQKYAVGQPIFLYGHPTGRLGRYPELLANIFSEIDARGDVWQTTMSNWAGWWRVRSRVKLTVAREGDDLIVDLQQAPSRYRLGLEYFRGRRVARLPLDKNRLRLSPDSLPFEDRPEQPTSRPVRVDRPHGLRGRVRRWIDWERETPVEEITPVNWRNVAKRTLRTLWS